MDTKLNMNTGYRYVSIPSLVDNPYLKTQKQIKMESFEKIKQLFIYEQEQVEIILALLWHYKRSYPLGISHDDVVRLLIEQSQYYLYKDKVYLLHLLNLMTALGFLELHINDASFDITSLGIEFFIECQKR